MNTLLTLATRIGKKTLALDKGRAKIVNLRLQIEMYEASIKKTEADVKIQQQEVDLLLNLKLEADDLTKKRDALQKYTDGLMKKYEAIPWSPDLAWEDKIESTDYAEKVTERHAINARLAEIEKIANKTYYRR